MPITFSRKADKHGVPHKSAWRVTLTTTGKPFTTNWGEPATLHIGIDDRGIELEVITVSRGADDLIVHAMPTSHRHKKGNRS